MANFDRVHSNSSIMVLISITLMDIILANITYWCLLNIDSISVPQGIIENSVDGALYATMAAIISLSFYKTIIHARRINITSVILRVFRLTLVQMLALIIILYIALDAHDHIIGFSIAYAIIYFAATIFSRFIERMLLNKIRHSGHNLRSVVFIGSDPANLDIYLQMKELSTIGYNVKGYYSNNEIQSAPERFNKLGTRSELVQAMRSGSAPIEADMIMCSLSTTNDRDDINDIIHYCDKHIIQFYLVPRIYSNLSLNLTPIPFGDYTLFTNHTNNINRIDNRIIKRVFDIAFSSIACICLLPIIPVVWIFIKIQSPGPLFFKQERTGMDGKTFLLYKFRSMHVNDDADRVQASKNDPRKFAFGNFMRKTNIDELPQFINVLKGDMSIVGPRPHMLLHTEMYSAVISQYMVRHFSKPGITGWAQVTGYRGETKELWQMEERVKRDIWYNENWSFNLDMEIIFRTAWSVIHPDKHAY
ncbi:MAG: exopolysaccharide biosynthesis polyprenyl glycosylphosphotransferase [Bacteroidales bacterium]|nr:exopolysaccharide biosynthesis polyprenyl glycosylphosphotransferase [Bacteroidales bacterium]MCM1205554.1 exopolysaccharide biosynthesis polyprenyl glycosylphosphotransferase [Bacillota bacterium]